MRRIGARLHTPLVRAFPCAHARVRARVPCTHAQELRGSKSGFMMLLLRQVGPRLLKTVKDMLRAVEKLLDHSSASLRALHRSLQEQGEQVLCQTHARFLFVSSEVF